MKARLSVLAMTTVLMCRDGYGFLILTYRIRGSVADRSIPHAASTLYHTWNGSVPKLSGRPNWPLMIL